MAAFISGTLLQDQECSLPARKRGDTQLLGTAGSPHFSRAGQALWELPTPRDATSYNHHEGRPQLHPQAPGEAPTHVLFFLHLSWAPHSNLSTLLRQDFKEEEQTSFFFLRSLFPQAFEFCSQGGFLFMIFHFPFPFIPQAPSSRWHQMSGLPWMAIYTHESFKSILTLKISSKCPCKHKFHQPRKNPFTYRHSRQ